MPNQVADYTISSRVDFNVTRNNTWQPRWTFTQNGAAFDISAYTFEMKVVDSTGTVIFDFVNSDFVRPSISSIGLNVTNAQMTITVQSYSYQLNATYPDTSLRTWFQGALIVGPSII